MLFRSIVLIFAFHSWKIRGGFIISILIVSLTAWISGLATMPTEFFSAPASIAPIALKLDIASALTLALLPVVISFLIADMFDSLGTLAGVGFRAKIFEEDDKALARTLEADAAATVGGSLLGLSTTTSFVESASGVEAGGRTGLTSIFTGLFFVLDRKSVV